MSILAIFQDGGFRTLLFREGVTASLRLDGGKERLLAMASGHLLIATAVGLLLVELLPLPYKTGLAAALACFALVVLSGFVSGE